EREIGDQMLQTPILVLERFQAPCFADVHAAVLALPAMVRLLADAVAANDVADLRARVDLAQHADDLLLRKPTLPHASSEGRTLTTAGSVSRGQVMMVNRPQRGSAVSLCRKRLRGGATQPTTCSQQNHLAREPGPECEHHPEISWVRGRRLPDA